MIDKTTRASWTFRISAVLTFVGLTVCLFFFSKSLTNPLPEAFEKDLSLRFTTIELVHEGPLYAQENYPRAIKVTMRTVRGEALAGKTPELTSETSADSRFNCAPSDEKGVSFCGFTPAHGGAHLISFANLLMLRRPVLQVLHSKAKLTTPGEDGTAGALKPAYVTVHLERPWNGDGPLWLFPNGERFASHCVPSSERKDWDCAIFAEKPGKKKLRLLRPALDEEIEVQFKPEPNVVGLEKPVSEVRAIGKTSESAQEQIVAFTLRDEKNRLHPGEIPPIRILARDPAQFDCQPANESGVAECRVFSHFSQTVEVWAEAPFATKKVSLSFAQPGLSFNPALVFDREDIVNIRFQSARPGQFASSVPVMVFSRPEVAIAQNCLPEVAGFFNCLFYSEEGSGLFAGGYYVEPNVEHEDRLRGVRGRFFQLYLPKKKSRSP